MIVHDVEQNSPEWHELRLGIPTASEFHRIITPKTRKLSSQAAGYLYRLLGEWITGESVENASTEWMQRGSELEFKAVLAYEMLTDTETQRAGFLTTDDGLIGCSPDRLIGDNGDLELKCPLIQTQVMYALTGAVDEEYMAQLQGRMMIHGREYVDIFSYHPALSIPAVRVKRDEAYIKDLDDALKAFTDLMLKQRELLERKFGPFHRVDPAPPENTDGFLSEEDAEEIIQGLKEEGETLVFKITIISKTDREDPGIIVYEQIKDEMDFMAIIAAVNHEPRKPRADKGKSRKADA